jgi:hypothetical protein
MTEKAVRLAGSILDRSRHVCAFFASKDEEYDLAKFGAGVVMDILRTHPMVIIGGILQENPFFVPPDAMLEELRQRRTLAR